MNVPRYIVASIVLFIFLFFWGWFVHGFLLMDMYEKTPQIWRDMADMKSHMLVYNVIQLILAFWFTYAFASCVKEGGVKKGFIFGIFFGVFAGLLAGAAYAYLPISAGLAWSWFFNGIIEWVIGGLIIGAIYRKR